MSEVLPKRILVVDDEETILHTIKKYLSLKGYSVDTSATGKEAIRMCRDNFYNLAILDIKLPDIDGTDLISEMEEACPRIVKIMLTGYPEQESAIAAVNRGADAYLVKPIELEGLLRVVKEKLKEQEEETVYSQEKVKEYLLRRGKELGV